MEFFSRLGLLCVSAVAIAIVLGLGGCATGDWSAPSSTFYGRASTPLTKFSISGTVLGGQQPVVGGHVYVMAVTGDGAGLNSGSGLPSTSVLNSDDTLNLDGVGAYVLTSATGGFSLSGGYVCPSQQAQMYLYVLGGNPGAGLNPSASFLAAVGTCGSISTNTHVTVNELSTVAAAYALAGFANSATDISVGSSAIAKQGLQNAFLNAQQLVGLASGAALSTTPNGNGVPDTAKINTLADILAACVNSTGTGGACTTLFNNALSGGATGTVPTDTASAAINLAKHPFVSRAVIQNLINNLPTQVPYPGVAGYPADLTIGIQYTGGGLKAPTAVAIDASGNALVTNSDGSVTKFSSTGVPSAGSGASATMTEALDGAQNAWYAAGTAGVVEQSGAAATLSPSGGFTGGGLNTPTSVAVDGSGDVWATNTTGSIGIEKGVDSVTELIGLATPVETPIAAPSGNTPAPGVDPSQPATPETLAQATVIHQVQLDAALHGHNMTISDCLAYVSMQNGNAQSKLAVVNVCGTDSNNAPQPVLVNEFAGSYKNMNGITVNGSNLYITYGWATNPFEVWTTGAGGVSPSLLGCVSLFTDAGYTSCGATNISQQDISAGENGALYGGTPFVLGNDVYVPENSDDGGQAVQVVNVSTPSAPLKVVGGISSGNDMTGNLLSGLWAPGYGTVLYVGTNANTPGQPVTITAYDAGQNASSPVKLGVSLNLPAGYLIENMGVQGTTVVANLYDATTASTEILVANFSNPSAPSTTIVAPTSGCIPGASSFIAFQDGYAFFGCGSLGTMTTGIEVLNISNPAAPVLLGQIATSLTRVGYILPEGRYLFAIDGGSTGNGGNFDTVDTGSLFVP